MGSGNAPGMAYGCSFALMGKLYKLSFSFPKTGTKYIYMSAMEKSDTLLCLMDEGALDVCALTSKGRYLWETYLLSRQQWLRLCGLLQRERISNSIVWQALHFMMKSECESWIEIEYLWTDLEAVQMYLVQFENRKFKTLVCELERRKAWAAGTRRAWLTAVL